MRERQLDEREKELERREKELKAKEGLAFQYKASPLPAQSPGAERFLPETPTPTRTSSHGATAQRALFQTPELIDAGGVDVSSPRAAACGTGTLRALFESKQSPEVQCLDGPHFPEGELANGVNLSFRAQEGPYRAGHAGSVSMTIRSLALDSMPQTPSPSQPARPQSARRASTTATPQSTPSKPMPRTSVPTAQRPPQPSPTQPPPPKKTLEELLRMDEAHLL